MANDMIEKLKYIGLNLEKIPDFLKITNKINYSSSKTEDSKKYKVYRYIDTDNIEILLTPTNRLNEIKVCACPGCNNGRAEDESMCDSYRCK